MRRSFMIAIAVTMMAASAFGVSVVTLGQPEMRRGQILVPVFAEIGGQDDVQAISLQVTISPQPWIEAVRIRRAGVIEKLEPLFEAQPVRENTASYVVSFDRAIHPVRFVKGQRNLVAEIQIAIGDGAADGAELILTLDPSATSLSNQEGTRDRTAVNGSLLLRDGRLIVAIRKDRQLP